MPKPVKKSSNAGEPQENSGTSNQNILKIDTIVKNTPIKNNNSPTIPVRFKHEHVILFMFF